MMRFTQSILVQSMLTGQPGTNKMTICDVWSVAESCELRVGLSKRKPCFELVDDGSEVVGQASSGFRDDAVRDHLVVCLSYAASYAAEGIGIASQRYCLSYRVLVVGRLQEGDDRFWNRALACFIEAIRRTDLVERSA